MIEKWSDVSKNRISSVLLKYPGGINEIKNDEHDPRDGEYCRTSDEDD